VIAIGITMIATGIQARDQPGGLDAVPWSAWPKEGCTLVDAVIAVTNIVFAYSFAITQMSMMAGTCSLDLARVTDRPSGGVSYLSE
jgi:hypothetical protein